MEWTVVCMQKGLNRTYRAATIQQSTLLCDPLTKEYFKNCCLLVDDLSIMYNTVREHAFSVLLNTYTYSLIYFFF